VHYDTSSAALEGSHMWGWGKMTHCASSSLLTWQQKVLVTKLTTCVLAATGRHQPHVPGWARWGAAPGRQAGDADKTQAAEGVLCECEQLSQSLLSVFFTLLISLTRGGNQNLPGQP
jgi:hypothetical protein